MRNISHSPNKSLMEKGFEFDKRLNRIAIALGLGIAAVGAVIAAPAAVAFGTLVTGGSIVGMEVSKRFERGYKNIQAKKK